MIKTSKQNVYGIYLRESIDTALLQKLSKALEFDFFVYYYSAKGSAFNDPLEGYRKGNKKNTFVGNTDAVTLEKELKDLREKYELLKALYEAKTKEKVPGDI